MLTVLPTYSSISIHEPPVYSIAVTNRSPSPPPPYTVPTYSFATSPPAQTEPRRAPKQVYYVHQCIGSWRVLTWILFLSSVALLHLVLFITSVKCALSENSLSYIRAFFFLHIIFLVGIIVSGYYKCKSRNLFTLESCLLATALCSIIPVAINVPFFMNYTLPEMTELNQAIQRPSSITDVYPCRLSFYKLVVGLTICDHIVAIICIITTFICFINHYLIRLQRHFNTNSAQS